MYALEWCWIEIGPGLNVAALSCHFQIQLKYSDAFCLSLSEVLWDPPSPHDPFETLPDHSEALPVARRGNEHWKVGCSNCRTDRIPLFVLRDIPFCGSAQKITSRPFWERMLRGSELKERKARREETRRGPRCTRERDETKKRERREDMKEGNQRSENGEMKEIKRKRGEERREKVSKSVTWSAVS